MAELSTLARPYAKAAFDYAKEQNAINNWEAFLSVASDVVRNEDYASLLNNPAISAAQKADILIDNLTEVLQFVENEKHNSSI